MVVPLAWFWRGRFRPYPAADDVLHTVNWMLLVGAFHAWRYRRGEAAARLSPGDAWLLGTGSGTLAVTRFLNRPDCIVRNTKTI